jgi:riboflavin kinase/FMN adenylyltransferase
MKAPAKNLTINGKVVHGDKLGRTVGYPTANLSGRTNLSDGVYAGWAFINRQRFQAVAIIGVDGKREVHILSWQGNLYGQNLRMTIVKRLRSIRRYSGLTKLKAQIRLDISRTKKILKADLLE